jgi:hypothetical protein
LFPLFYITLTISAQDNLPIFQQVISLSSFRLFFIILWVGQFTFLFL